RDRDLGVNVHVDEARGYDPAAGVDLLTGGGISQLSDRGHPVTHDAELGREGRLPRAVNDLAVANNDVELQPRSSSAVRPGALRPPCRSATQHSGSGPAPLAGFAGAIVPLL